MSEYGLPRTPDPRDKKLAQSRIQCASLRDQVKALKKALAFYSDAKNYDQFGVCHNDDEDCSCRMKHHHPDCGYTARKALGL